VESH
jgi:hypothetical protein